MNDWHNIYEAADGVRRYLNPGMVQDTDGNWIEADDRVADEDDAGA